MKIFLRLSLIVSFLFVSHAAFAGKPELTFYTVKDWMYSGGPTCNLANEFNNGFLMQFHGQDGRLVAVSLDVRQSSFVSGQKYSAGFSVPDRVSNVSIESYAQNASTIVMNISPREDVYQALREQAALDVRIEDNHFRFYLGAFDSVANDFAQCLGRSPQPKAMSDIVVSTNADKSVVWSEPQDDSMSGAGGLMGVQPLKHEGVSESKVGLDYLGISENSKVKVNREMMTGRANFVDEHYNEKQLRRENANLRDELNMALKESKHEEMSLKSENWDLERSTMMYQEAERQANMLGQKLRRQEMKCAAEKKELESMLFDPMVTSEQQLSRLAALEDELANAQEELRLQRMRYDERIRLLENRLQTQ